MRQKIFDWNFWYFLPPPLSLNFFTTGNFLKQSTEGFLYEMFRYCETKQFWRKSVIPASSLMPYIFRYPKWMKHWTLKDSSTKFFSTVRQKILDGKFWYFLTPPLPSPPLPPPPLPPPLSIKFFDTRNFVKHWRVPYKIFWHWDKNFLMENVIPFCIKYRNQWWNWYL